MQKIRVGAVSYLNTRPLIYGIKNHPVSEKIDLVEDYPSLIANMLARNELDLGLVPVALIPKLDSYHIITDFCIGAEGPVASVCLFSEVPIEEVTEVYLDYQSMTSVNLARILLAEYWKIKPSILNAQKEDYRNKIKGTTAAVVIGDRALEQRKRSTFTYDLAEAWKAQTGLPFVFAAWISNKELPADFIKDFNDANAEGVAALDQVVSETLYDVFDLKAYYSQYISYSLTRTKRKGLELFLDKLRELPAL